ncbi:hypothetical protein SAMN02745133_00285 [Desulforamulus putei DSM 12395]|uniref:Uncharacterized protein n=1 Tax=Desulforamulus putei DSM 12395 TaxID=1121429 RepID=A0A1M4SYP1_9FIRM|nr:hypothetical protein SAMN02745133_00285 [Desulforamulus putei DSM 12395]
MSSASRMAENCVSLTNPIAGTLAAVPVGDFVFFIPLLDGLFCQMR